MSVFKAWFDSAIDVQLYEQGYSPCPCCGAWHSRACECVLFWGLCLTHGRKPVNGALPRFWDVEKLQGEDGKEVRRG